MQQQANHMKEQMDMIRSLGESSKTAVVLNDDSRTAERAGDKLVLTKLGNSDTEAFLTIC